MKHSSIAAKPGLSKQRASNKTVLNSTVQIPNNLSKMQRKSSGSQMKLRKEKNPIHTVSQQRTKTCLNKYISGSVPRTQQTNALLRHQKQAASLMLGNASLNQDKS